MRIAVQLEFSDNVLPAKYADEYKCDFDYAEIPVISPYWRKERELCVY